MSADIVTTPAARPNVLITCSRPRSMKSKSSIPNSTMIGDEPFLCAFFNSGVDCFRGRNCPHVHDVKLRGKVVGKKKSLQKAKGDQPMKDFCRFYITGGTCLKEKNPNSKCAFIHDLSLRLTALALISEFSKNGRTLTEYPNTKVPNALSHVPAIRFNIMKAPGSHDSDHMSSILNQLEFKTSIGAITATEPTARFNRPSNSTKYEIKPGLFPFFSELPTEVRLQIWHEFLDKSALTVVVRLFDEKNADGQPTRKKLLKRMKQSPIPSLLRVCQESRQEALKKYQLSCGDEPSTYVNYAKDYIFLDTRKMEEILPILDALSSTDLASIQNLTMKVVDWSDSRENDFRERIWKFSSLRKLRMVAGNLDQDKTFSNLGKGTSGIIKEELAADKEHRPEGWKLPKVCLKIVQGVEYRAPFI